MRRGVMDCFTSFAMTAFFHVNPSLVTRIPNRLNRFVAVLPYDAWGLDREKDELALVIRRFINAQRWQRFSFIARPFMKLGLRALWLVWCPYSVYSFLRAQAQLPDLVRQWIESA